jgi:hypothetical protein
VAAKACAFRAISGGGRPDSRWRTAVGLFGRLEVSL